MNLLYLVLALLVDYIVLFLFAALISRLTRDNINPSPSEVEVAVVVGETILFNNAEYQITIITPVDDVNELKARAIVIVAIDPVYILK